MGSILKIGLALIVVLVILLVVVVRFIAVSYLTPDYLVREIEGAMNCRADIGALKLKLLGSPARVRLSNVALGPRDEFAASAIALKDRPPFEQQAIHCGEAVLEVRLTDLLSRKLHIGQLTLENLNAQVTLYEDGSNSLNPIFGPPQALDGGKVDMLTNQRHAPEGADPDDPLPPLPPPPSAPAPPKIPPPPGAQLSDESPSSDEAKSEEAPRDPTAPAFHANEIPVAMLAESIGIKGGTIYATVAKNGGTIMVDEIQLAITNVDIDPDNLDAHNQADMELSMIVGVDSRPELGKRFAEFHLAGTSRVVPFDPRNGLLEPELLASVSLQEGTYIDALPTLEAVGGLMKKLEKLGIELGDVDLRGDLEKSATIELGYRNDVVTLLKNAEIGLKRFTVRFKGDSWINTNSAEHEFTGEVLASEERTQKAIEEVDKFLKKKAGPLATPETRNTLLMPVMKEGRIGVAFQSSGSLAKPKVTLVTRIGSITDVLNIDPEQIKQLETQGKEMLNSLKKAFGF